MYCQLGRTVSFGAARQRKDFFPREEILEQVISALEKHKPQEIDWITFVGSGEPTLHTSLGWLIEEIKRITPKPVAVLTNGSLFYQPEIREALSAADAVLPTLDAGTEQLYRRVNRPLPHLTFERHIRGLVDFRQAFKGRYWLETMLVKGLNDSENALIDIAHLIEQIQPHEVHINTPTRPPAEDWVEPPDDQSLITAREIIGATAKVIIPIDMHFTINETKDLVDGILNIITRHPMSEDQLTQSLADHTPEDIKDVLQSLAGSGKAQVIERYGRRFWSTVEAKYRK